MYGGGADVVVGMSGTWVSGDFTVDASMEEMDDAGTVEAGKLEDALE